MTGPFIHNCFFNSAFFYSEYYTTNKWVIPTVSYLNLTELACQHKLKIIENVVTVSIYSHSCFPNQAIQSGYDEVPLCLPLIHQVWRKLVCTSDLNIDFCFIISHRNVKALLLTFCHHSVLLLAHRVVTRHTHAYTLCSVVYLSLPLKLVIQYDFNSAVHNRDCLGSLEQLLTCNRFFPITDEEMKCLFFHVWLVMIQHRDGPRLSCVSQARLHLWPMPPSPSGHRWTLRMTWILTPWLPNLPAAPSHTHTLCATGLKTGCSTSCLAVPPGVWFEWQMFLICWRPHCWLTDLLGRLTDWLTA